MKKRKEWTQDEIAFIVENYPKYGLNYCFLKTGRNRNVIIKKCKSLGLTPNKEKYSYDKELLEEFAKKSKTKSEMMLYMGLQNKGGNYKTLNRHIFKYGIDISHFVDKKNFIIKERKSIEFYLVKDSFCNRTNLKERLYKEGLKKRECELCEQGEIWQGKKISLILDHINGISNDNRIENLRIVCPNCNATLETHCGKNAKRINNSKSAKRRESVHINKMIKNEKVKQKIESVLNSDVDFSKWGWSSRVAKLLGIIPQKANSWMKKHMPEFYSKKCYKKDFDKYFCSICGEEIEGGKTGMCEKCNRNKNKKVPSHEQLIKDLSEMSRIDVAKKYEMNRTTLYKYCKRHGIE